MIPIRETVRITTILRTTEIHLPFPEFLIPNTRAIIGHRIIEITTIGPKFPNEMFAWIRPKRIRDMARKIYGNTLDKVEPPISQYMEYSHCTINQTHLLNKMVQFSIYSLFMHLITYIYISSKNNNIQTKKYL